MKKKIQMHRKVLTLEEGIELWMVNCRRRGLTENTIKYYHDITKIFVDTIGYKTGISAINCQLIDNFIIKLQDTRVKTTTINSYLNGIRSICYWLIRQQYIKPFVIEKIKCDEVIKDTFSQSDVKAILIKKPNVKKCTFLEYEAWVLCNTFYGLGARSSTIAELKISDLDLDGNYVFYRKVKDRKQTIIPMGSILVDILKEFLTHRKGEPDDYVFVNSFSGKLNKDSLNDILTKFYITRGVLKSGVHIWRRTFAKDYILNGGNALMLQAQLCHKTLDMTKKYVSLYGKDIRDDSHNPLELMNKSDHIRLGM